MYVILTNYVNWHRENLRSDSENTGNLKIQFEWVPCKKVFNFITGEIEQFVKCEIKNDSRLMLLIFKFMFLL